MRQDRKLNGWVLFSSIVGIVVGMGLIAIGGALAAIGYFKPEKLLNISDLTFFINQNGIIKFQRAIFDALLKDEFLYLFIGLIIIVAGLITLIFAIEALNFAKKRKISHHRKVIIIFSIIYIAIVASVVTYLVLEFNNLTDNIKYIAYGIAGVYGLIVLCNLLGAITNRSEQFMSNDNSKYAFDNSSLRNARVNVNNNVRDAQVYGKEGQQYQPSQNTNIQQISRPQQPINMLQRVRPQQYQGARQIQPNQATMRPQQGQQMQRIQTTNAHPAHAPRPQINGMAQSTARPVTRTANSMPTRPMMHTSQVPPRPTQNIQSSKFCVKCGKLLKDDETICSLCGHKTIK